MSGCYTCGGGMGKHDPVAHDWVPENDEPCICGHPGLTYDGPDEDCPTHGRGCGGPVVDLLSGWWYMRPGESMDEHAARLKADPRWQQ